MVYNIFKKALKCKKMAIFQKVIVVGYRFQVAL